MKLNYSKWLYLDPTTKSRNYVYVPIFEVFLVSNHKVGKPVKSYLDSGAIFNIFPMEYARFILGYSVKSLKKGIKLPIIGVGGSSTIGYGHKCSIQHPKFKLENLLVYFVENQPYPLLGRVGFMDRFKQIIFNESEKFLELKL